MADRKNLVQKIEAMAPWHHIVEISPGIYTGRGSEKDPDGRTVSQIRPKKTFDRLINRIYPNGLDGKTFLDCACNAGGYCFAAKEAGAREAYGFDIRKHWIDQANFILEHREADNRGLTFDVADLQDLGQLEKTFDITWFSGIFYHLPDPVHCLKLAADKTNEIIVLNTACEQINGSEAPGLVLKREGKEALMSGVYELSWLPTGPKVLKNLLAWAGFEHSKVFFWMPNSDLNQNTPPGRVRNHARIGIVASRDKSLLENLNEVEVPETSSIAATSQTPIWKKLFR